MNRALFRAHRGTSLVEILVAMVVLLLGIFALVRLFPSGFTSILYGRNVSQAQALMRGMIEAARTHAGELPDTIEAVNPATGLPDPTLQPLDELLQFPRTPPSTALLTTGPPPDTRFSDLNQVRHVVGETTRIPAPTTSSLYMAADGKSGQRLPVSLYVLQFGPIYSATVAAAPVGTKPGPGGVSAYAGNALSRIVLNGPPGVAEMAALQQDPFSYGIDYGNATLYFAPAPNLRAFKLTYSFTLPAGPNQVAHEQAPPGTTVIVPANTNSFDMRQAHPGFFPLPAGTQLDNGGEALYRGFLQLAADQPFSDTDPYEFKVLNPVVGVIGFNPLGSTPGAGGSGVNGITAKIDYDVDDWHIIHEDRVVPDSAPKVVNLTLNGIEPIGAVDEYQETYGALMKEYPGQRPTPTPNIDLLVLDLETGLTADSSTMQPLTNGDGVSTNNSNGEIDYRTGAIQFSDATHWSLQPGGLAVLTTPSAGRRVRVYYRTPQDWGVQLTKAATEYARVPATPNLGYQEYYQGTNGYLFFPVQDHDQAVLVDYTWTQQENGQQVVRTETGEYHQLLDPALGTGPANPAQNWWTQVDAAMRGDAVNGSIQVLRVRGVSVRARAIWREGSRWRSLALDSYIGRDQGN